MTGRYGWCLLLVGACLACVGFVTTAGAQCPLSFDPASINFGNQSVEVASAEVSITVTDTLQKNVGVSGFSVTSPFQILSGHAPYVFTAGARTGWSIVFAPKAVGPFSGQLTLNLSGGYPPCVVPLTGTGISTGAVSSVSPTIINFGNVTEGSITPPQAITVTNTGTSELTVESATSSSDFFTVQGFTTPVVLNPGQSLGLTATFSAVGAQGYTGTLDLTYDVLPSNGVSFSGTGTAASTLTIDSLQILPDAIQGSNYSAQLEAAGGTPPYTWKLNSGSSLPAGLALAGGGTITGTVASSVLPGNYSFSVAMHDSSPQASTTAQFTIPVSATTGANCNRIQADIAGTSNPLVAITDLGTGTYLGAEGGLYPNGSNVRPAGQDAAGVALAQQIGPLDANGNPDPNGLYGLVTIGISITQDESDTFVSFADADPSRNSQLVVVNGAQPAGAMSDWSDPTSGFWSTLLNYLLPNVGLTPNQVVVAWVEDIDANPTGTFPGDITQLEADLTSAIQVALTKFPNLKLMYISSSPYTGYAPSNKKLEQEPYAYETAFAAQQVIGDQLSGDPALNYNPALGPVVAPWLSWGPYYWTNGLRGRNDGFVWPCQDSQTDGTHPSDPYGTDEVADALLHFYKTDDSAAPWFLAPPGPVVVLSPSSLTFAAQNVGTSSPAQMITLSNTGTAALNISNIGVTGADPGDFTQTNTCPASLAVGTSCTISVTFTPAATGTQTASVSITDNALRSPQFVLLTGTGGPGTPVLTLSPTSLTFPTQLVGTVSAAQVVTLTNTGTATLSISNFAITGAESADFAKTNTCGTSMAVGANCTISVTFRPTNRNNRTASLSITDNASGSPQTVALTGVGTDITLAPTSLVFGGQGVGSTSAAQTVTLTNKLAVQAISITSISLSGANPGDFAETNTCGTSVGAQASCTISVTFTPTATGTRTASVMITDNGGGSPQSVGLTGTGKNNHSSTSVSQRKPRESGVAKVFFEAASLSDDLVRVHLPPGF
jgi:hypothetical protein